MFRAISFTMAATLAGQVLNFFTDILIANYFGTSWRADAYLLALVLPVIVYDLFITGISATFVPLYISRKKFNDEEDFFSTVINSTVLITFLISAILFFLVPYLIDFIASGFSQEAKQLTVILTRLLLFLIIVMPISMVLTNLLNAHNQFAIPALGKAMNFASIVLTMTFLVKLMGIFSLVFGFLVGSLLFLSIQIYLVRRVKVKYSLLIHIKHPALKEMAILLLPLLLATLVNYVNIFVERSVAASFSEGSIAALNYAFKVINIPINLLVLAAMPVILPTLSGYAAENNIDSLKELTLKGLKFISFLITPIITGIIIFRVPLIRFLFERGEFTAESTAITASSLMFYAFGIFGLSAVTLLARVFYALKDIKTLSKIGVSMIVVNIVLIIFLSKTIGFEGIPLTFSITSNIHMLVMLGILGKRQNLHLTTPFLTSFIKHAFSSGIMAAVCLLLVMGMNNPLFSSTVGRGIFLILALLIGACCYAIASIVARVKEVGFVFEKARDFKERLLKNREVS
jgi:putative peptidoglycan lipid II flippase